MQDRRQVSRRAVLGWVAAAGVLGVVFRRQVFRPAGLRRLPGLFLPKPTAEQLAWQDLELGLFIHLGMPTYTGEVGQVSDPAAFNPVELDCDQWMEAAKAMGARYAVLVAKHTDGFLGWQSDLYPYGVRQSPWRDGKGDLVALFVDACARHGIKPGVYACVSVNGYSGVGYPGRVAAGRGPDAQAAYNRLVERMIRELLSRYGPLVELWFDGDVLPPEKGGPDLAPIIDELQPGAVCLQGPTASIRLSGGETGMVDYPCWGTARRRGAMGPGHPEGKFWLPVECDTPMRDREWFWRPGQDDKVHTLAALEDMCYKSVGRNGNLLLNANPDRNGLVPAADMQRYRELGALIKKQFSTPIAETSGRGRAVEIDLPAPAPIDHVVLMEDIANGERVRAYEVQAGEPGGRWRTICKGLSIGHKRIHRFTPRRAVKIRVTCTDSIGTPALRKLAVYATT